MMTLPAPVAVVIGICQLAIAVALAMIGSHWLAAFLVAGVTTAALFLRRVESDVCPDETS